MIDSTLAQVRSEKADTSTKLAETLSKLKHCNETKLTLSEKLSDQMKFVRQLQNAL
jgi:hypothetical protein